LVSSKNSLESNVFIKDKVGNRKIQGETMIEGKEKILEDSVNPSVG
jgi:hypothetical protein